MQLLLEDWESPGSSSSFPGKGPTWVMARLLLAESAAVVVSGSSLATTFIACVVLALSSGQLSQDRQCVNFVAIFNIVAVQRYVQREQLTQ